MHQVSQRGNMHILLLVTIYIEKFADNILIIDTIICVCVCARVLLENLTLLTDKFNFSPLPLSVYMCLYSYACMCVAATGLLFNFSVISVL